MLSVKKPLAILVTGISNPNPTIGDMYYKDSLKMINSLKKTNPDIEKKADIKLYTDKDAVRNGFTLLPNDLKMRYMTPIFIKELLKEYECVVRLDSDMFITGDISSCWEGNFDVAVAQNANPREIVVQNQMMGRTVTVWDLKPLEEYVNCGFVVVKSEKFVDHWLSLCTPERQHYQFYEQDFLNICVYYGPNYKVKFLDKEKNNKWHGLISKGYWSEIIIKDKKLILPKKSGTDYDMWPPDEDKEIVCIHIAEGNRAGKFEGLETRFQPEVMDYLNFLISDEKKT